MTNEQSTYKSTKFLTDILGEEAMDTLVNDTILKYTNKINHTLHTAAFLVCPEPRNGKWEEWESAMA